MWCGCVLQRLRCPRQRNGRFAQQFRHAGRNDGELEYSAARCCRYCRRTLVVYTDRPSSPPLHRHCSILFIGQRSCLRGRIYTLRWLHNIQRCLCQRPAGLYGGYVCWNTGHEASQVERRFAICHQHLRRQHLASDSIAGKHCFRGGHGRSTRHSQAALLDRMHLESSDL